MSEVAIRVNNVSKLYKLYDKPMDRLKESLGLSRKQMYKEHYALRNVSFDVHRGETVGIIGTNGSGKSTMLKIITGVLNPTEGDVQIQGRISALLELGAGFNPEYTGIENIYLNGTMMGYTEQEMEKRVPAIVDFADIGEFIYQPVKSYSSGMFARLAFAVSINVEPDILIVDEALSVGDTRFQVKCIDKMRELQESGTTILFVTHAIEQIKRFCTRAIWIKNGEIAEDGEASQVVDLYDNFMKYGERKIEKVDNNEEFKVPENSDYLAVIQKVAINKNMFKSFEKLEVEITYDVYDEHMEDLQVGVAFYSLDRKIYVFGPNTNLDKFKVPQGPGRHIVKYVVPDVTLISGDYTVDVGIFNSGGIVNLDYKNNCEKFSVANEYFSEGMFYIEHQWEIKQ